MAGSDILEGDAAERRVYHAQLITCLAVIPTFMALAGLATGVSFGDRDLRGVVLAHPFALLGTFAVAMLFVFAWWLMGRRQRAGVVLAAALFGWMLVSALLRVSISFFGVLFAALGLVLLARAWPAMRRPATLVHQ